MTRVTRRPAASLALARALVRWFHVHCRDLPWRRTRDPYSIWVSETMLQQTRVAAVVPYYERFLARFPDVHALARAPLDDVLAAWSGLGYYRRARQMKAAAEAVVRDHGGRLPDDEAALRALPGVGRYTAGALLSIAFERRAALVDGNVSRVLARLFALSGGPGKSAFERRVWALAETLVPASDPSAFNQGLMEIGATICLPRAPLCTECPLARHCRARAAGRPEAYPKPRPRARPVRAELWALVLARRGRYLLRRRGEGEHNAGFWEFPTFEAPDRTRDGEAATVASFFARTLARAGGPRLAPGTLRALAEGPSVRHAILTRDLRIRVFCGAFPGRPAGLAARSTARRRSEGWGYSAPRTFALRPFTAASRKIARKLGIGARAWQAP